MNEFDPSLRKIRVMIVDDSLVIRRLIAEGLSKDPLIEVVGQISSGRQACEKILEINPDIVTMDIEMPEMSGIETLKEFQKIAPKIPVIMFSSLTRQGATTVLEALVAGAKDYATKPSDVGKMTEAILAIEQELVPKIKALCIPKPLRNRIAKPSVESSGSSIFREQKTIIPPSGIVNFKQPVEIFCIGCSTGGPNALSDFFKGISASFPVPIVIVQHMPPMFTKILAERLTTESALRVYEGEEGMRIRAGEAYIAPGGKHMVVEKDQQGAFLKLNEDPQENSCRPAVDVLFRSVVRLYGAATLGLVMTGMGRDGAAGCELIRKAGGKIVIQDEATSVVWGMPGAVYELGIADAMLPLLELSPAISRWVDQSQKKGRT